MNVKRLEMEPVEDETFYATTDEAELPDNFCMANVGDNNTYYLSCGERLRRRKSGVELCPTHGEMH